MADRSHADDLLATAATQTAGDTVIEIEDCWREVSNSDAVLWYLVL
jgi:hypothetical protein